MIRILLVALVLGVMPSAAAADRLPFYCKVLERFERSCTGARAASFALGKNRALAIARRCGATEYELQQAQDCLAKKPQK